MPVALLKRLFGLGASNAKLKSQYPHPAEELLPAHLIRDLREGTWRQLKYPPFQEGFPARKSGRDLMMVLHPELVTRLRASLGLSDTDFDRLVEPILVNFAELVHLLPASEKHHHSGPGGLIRHCLEVANYSLDGCLTTSFDSTETPSRKSARSLRWRVAGLAAGLLHDAGKALTDMRVVDFKGDLTWTYAEGTIVEWATKHDIHRYFIYWNDNRHENHIPESAALTTKVIPPYVEAWLSEFGRDIYTDMLKAVQGIPSRSKLSELVKRADQASVELDVKRGSRDNETGVPVGRMVSDCMLRLLERGDWKVNTHGARVWVAKDGVYIAWNSGAEDIVKTLVSDGVVAIPRSPDTLIGILADHDIAERTDEGDLYWLVSPHLLRKNGRGPALKCLKLSNPKILFPLSAVPDPVSISLGREGDQVDLVVAGDVTTQDELGHADADQLAEEAAEGKGESKPEKSKDKKSAPPAPPVSANPSVPSLVIKPNVDEDDQDYQQEAEQDEPDQESQPEELDRDASIESMLMALNPLAVQIEHVEASAASEQSNAEPIAAEEPPRPSTGKVSLMDLLGSEPGEPSRPSPKRASSLSAIMAADTLNEPNIEADEALVQPADGEQLLAPPADEIVEEPLVLPVEVLEKLDQEEIIRLKAQPTMARKLLAACAEKEHLRVVHSKVFIPFEEFSQFTPCEIDRLRNADWIWQDFTAEQDEGVIRLLNKRQGFVLCPDMSLIVAKLTDDFSTVDHFSLIPETELEAWQEFVSQALQVAARETIGSVETFALSFNQFDDIAARCGIKPADAERALFALRDTLRNVRRRRFYIRANREEYMKK